MILPNTSPWDAAQQADRVRVARVAQHRFGIALLDQPTGVQHADAIAHLADDPEVVADEQHRGAELRLQAGDEVEHLRLDGRIEPGRRLVEDQERRLGCEGHRDHHALLHATGELVRVPRHHRARVGDLHALECVTGEIGRVSPFSPRMRNTSATCLPTRIDGFRAEPGFW